MYYLGNLSSFLKGVAFLAVKKDGVAFPRLYIMSNYRWLLNQVEPAKVMALQQSLGLGKVTSTILVGRGIDTEQVAKKFLEPRLLDLYPPQLLYGMKTAATRIKKAVENQEQIYLYGDYDVDGVTSIALLYECLTMLHSKVAYYIPNRLQEGYGLNIPAVHKIVEAKGQLMITVDCGINAIEAVQEANKLGIEVIITDHHELGAELPPAFAIINPKDHRANYPCKGIAGVGVAFKLAWAVCQEFSDNPNKVMPEHRKFLLDALSLVSLGTIADVAPLIDENRIFAKFGLITLSHTQQVGIQALKDVSACNHTMPVTSEHIGFRLGPRLNAMGRLEDSLSCVELLITQDRAHAYALAKKLDLQNQRRKSIQENIYCSAKDMIKNLNMETHKVLTLAQEGWHPGVVGIVATRLQEEFYRPILMIALSDGEGRGSGRSVPGFHLFQALQHAEQYLLAYGGHEMAAGFRIKKEQIENFAHCMNQHANQILTPEHLQPSLAVSASVSLRDINWNLIEELEKLAPFGEGNHEPLLLAEHIEIVKNPGVERYGSHGDHLGFRVRENDSIFRVIAFGQGKLFEQIQSAQFCDLVFTPKKNTWGGNNYIQLQVKDIHLL